VFDINFFSIYRKKKKKSNGFKIFLIVFLGLFLIGNALLIGFGLMLFGSLEESIAAKQAQIDSPETKAKIAAAERIKKEAVLTNEYLTLLQRASQKLGQMNRIDTTLLDEIREMTPPDTYYAFTEYNGITVNLECVSSQITDPMDMYHAFRENPIFATVILSGINVLASGEVSFSLICQLAGGASK
jgi:hypothetical protein